MTYWQGKVALVTGGSVGLGRAIAGALAARGAKVVIAARNGERLRVAAESLRTGGAEVLPVAADVTRQDEVDSLFAETISRFGQLDLLVNNAGRSARGAVLETDAAEFAALLDLNFLGLVRCTCAAAEHLLDSRGHVVNIGSLAGKAAVRYMGAYAATKFAVAAYSQQLRLELGPRGLHVLLVSTGPITRDEPLSTERQAQQSALAGLPESAQRPGAGAKVKMLLPDDLAERILRACERRQPELTLPARARLLFALAALSPRLGDWLVRRFT
jgi:short-subunit dehydrogenase